MPSELDQICTACGLCDGSRCAAIATQAGHKFDLPDTLPSNYDGRRYTADAMDCALPIALDSHSGCSFSCLYCFANNLQRAPDRNKAALQKMIDQGTFYSEWSLQKLEKFLDRSCDDVLSKSMYPMLDRGLPVQLGALGDPFDDLERHTGWARRAIPLFIKYKVPVRVGTKGGITLQRPEYRKLFERSPEQFWFAWSIICNSDELISKIDVNAPVTSDRLKAMRGLTDLGCNCSIRFRPFLPGVSDSYPGEPEAWKTLIYRARQVGARAISFEFIFLDAVPTARQKAMSRLMFRYMGNPRFGEEWRKMSDRRESCLRGSRAYKFDMTMKVREYVHSLDMTFGCSDPAFKEFNDTGCCCGMPETGDKWFSNWSRRQMTEVIVQAKRLYDAGTPRQFNYLDWAPEWAHLTGLSSMVALNSWHAHRMKKNTTFGDHMRNKWNDPSHPRGPYIYFGKVLKPIAVDSGTGDLIYEYRPWYKGYDHSFMGEPNARPNP